YALEPEVDLIMTEMRNTRYRQPTWYRYIRGFAGEKPVVVVENPYGGIVPELVAKLQRGQGYDLFRMSLYEAAALGTNMSVPYGSWMGSVQEDAFYAPHDLCVEIQGFLADHEFLYAPTSLADTAVIYSVESNFYGGARPEDIANNPENAVSNNRLPFWEVCECLADARQPYDVHFFPEGTLRADLEENLELDQYRTVILPYCDFLTEPQADALARFLVGGGRIVATGIPGENLEDEQRRAIADDPATSIVEAFTVDALADETQVTWHAEVNLAVNIVPVERGVAIHIIRYDHDDEADAVPVLPELEFTVRLDGDFDSVRCFSPVGELAGSMARDGDQYRVTLENVPLYGIVLLEGSNA
ncbi:MAG: hypothetical protein H0V37_02580, partial [Chloroflexia bacterium]|nr:hypothetical protein [Chloroflexia bacterium]